MHAGSIILICRNLHTKIGTPIIAITLVLIALPLGQLAVISDELKSIPLSFINFQDNTISYKPNVLSSFQFASVIQKAKSGVEPVRILHIGDSHVQADIFTGETRRLMASWLADANPSRGFTFPYRLAGTNNPFDFDVSSDVKWRRERIVDVHGPAKLGVAGIALFTSSNKGSIEIKLKKQWSSSDGFNLVKVYYDEDQGPTQFNSSNAGNVISQNDGQWVFHLDTISESFRFNFSAGEGSPKGIRIYGMELLSSNSKVVYHATGVNGAEVRTYLLSQNLEKLVRQIDPHLVILSLGTNDAYNNSYNSRVFRENLAELVNRIRNANPEIMVILSTPGDHLAKNQSENPFLQDVQESIYSIANEHNCGVWDFYQVMGGEGSIKQWAQHGLCSPDFLHLNRTGYRLKGALLFSALVELSGNELLEDQQIEITNQ